MGFKGTLKAATLLIAVSTFTYAVKTKKPNGRFLNVPYDFRMPTAKKIRNGMWNRNDSRMMTPIAFGIGWTPNVFQLFNRLQNRRTRSNSQDGPEQTDA